MKALRESVAARGSCKVGARRVYSSVMNCSFNNPKSSGFFPRLHDEEEWNNGLDCMGIQEGWYWIQYEDCMIMKENRLKYYSLF